MNRTVLTVVFLLIFSSSVFSEKYDSPNIIIIYTDQQRFNTIHSLGNKEIITPNLDKLVEGGTAFTNAYVTSPVCMASRRSLHTGMYTTSHQTYSNHHGSNKNAGTTMPLEFKKRGYKTVLLGKNHSFLTETEMDFIYDGKKYLEDVKDKRSAEVASVWTVEEDPMHVLTNKALSVLEENKGTPVFMWLSYLYPHTPYMCPEPYFSMYDSLEISKPVVEKNGLYKAGKPFRQQYHQINNDLAIPYDEAKTMRMKRTYYGMISMLDYEIGRLIQFLEKTNMRKNTLIVFTSDHGDYMGDHGLYTKSPAMYDCLTRVPLIFNWPEKIKQTQVSDALVSSTDIMPTLLDFAEIDIPTQVQGLSLLNLLQGKSGEIKRDFVFCEYGIPGKPILEKELQQRMPDYKEKPILFETNLPWEGNPVALAGRFRMIRSKDYKLVEEIGGTNEFYDIRIDPNELSNKYNSPEYAFIQEEMHKALHEWKAKLPGIELDTFPMGENNFQQYLKIRNK